jgi:hypothetical protein
MQLSGSNNQIIFPTAQNPLITPNLTAKLTWGNSGDITNLYKSATGILTSDADFITSSLTSNNLTENKAVATDANKKLVSSSTTDTELGYLSGASSNIQTQITGKVSKAGDTMSGALTLPDTTAGTPMLNFTNNPTVGLSAQSGILSINTNASPRMQINSDGEVYINKLGATAGVIHNTTSGLENSLIVDSDITIGTIANNKLQQLTSANLVANSATTASSATGLGTIVARDNSGNFAANIITASLLGNATTATTAGNFTGELIGDVTGTQSNTSVIRVGGATGVTSDQINTGVIAANSATEDNTPNTIIKRDDSGYFTANMTGAASFNVLKSGDVMTGDLLMANKTIKLQDFYGTNYVGLKAPNAISSSYTVNLPTGAPLANQFLQASTTTPNELVWKTINGVPANTKMIYVTVNGSDITGNGSIYAPFGSISKAVEIANSLARSYIDAITINVGSGLFYENPMQITSDSIFIIGQSIADTTVVPSDPAQNLLSIYAANAGVYNISFVCEDTSLATALVITTTASGFIELEGISFNSFQTGIDLTGGDSSSFVLASNIQTINNGTAISINNATTSLKNCNMLGGTSLAAPANTGFNISGANSIVYISDSTILLFNDGLSVTNSAQIHILSSTFQTNINSITCNNSSKASVIGCNFITNTPYTTNISSSQPGTSVYVEGCLFDCNYLGTQQGTCIKVTDGAEIIANNSTLDQAAIGIDCGQTGDTETTKIIASSVTIRDCALDIKQTSTSTINFTGGKFSDNKLSIENPENVHITSFDEDGSLTIGNTSDIQNKIYKIANGQPAHPTVKYLPNYYGAKGTIYQDSNTGVNSAPACNGVQSDKESANYYLVTGDSTKQTKINLISDTSSDIGSYANIRGWEISKLGNAGADLAFTYTNNDPGSAIIGPNTIMKLDAVNNQIILPASINPSGCAKLVWGNNGDNTNLYKSDTNTLKTDGNFIIGGVVVGSTLTIPTGTESNPSLSFTNDTNTGIYSSEQDNISIATAGAKRFNIDSSGNISVNNFALGTTGIVHSNTAGILSSSAIVGSDIASNTIPDSKLQQITSLNKIANTATTATDLPTNGAIVSRNSTTGDFGTFGTISAGLFSGPLTGNVTGNIFGNASTATSAVTFSTALTGDLSGGNNGSASTVTKVGGQLATDVANATILTSQATNDNTANRIVRRGSAGEFSAGTIIATQFSGPLSGDVTGNLIGNADTATLATRAISATGFSGALSGDITGTQGATVVSYVGGATGSYIASGAKLANDATSSAVINTVVKRDGSGRFVTDMITLNGTVSAATDAATKNYVDTQVLTGGLDTKIPAKVIETTSNISITGTTTIDSVLVAAGDRVLLDHQTTTSENGLWIVQDPGAWSRPSDFDTSSTAGKSYVLITEGATNAGSSWVCNTPLATIDTDPISFVLFSLPDTTTAANVGTGAGQIFKNKTSNTINLRTLAALTYMNIATNITNNTVDIGTNATSTNTPNTIIARDANGYFSASGMTGIASGNVKITGDTMTGNLNIGPSGAARSELHFIDTNTNYIGLRAPSTIGANYTIDLPNIAPQPHQVLMATSATGTKWENNCPPPAATKTYYVSPAGNNDTGDGSAAFPYKNISKALELANAQASSINPITIYVGAGVFLEDNPEPGIEITADGISIAGSSLSGTVILAKNPGNPLFGISTSNVGFYDLTVKPYPFPASTNSAIKLTTTSFGRIRFNSVGIVGFKIGLEINSSVNAPIVLLNEIQSMDNETCIWLNNVISVIQSSVFQGSSTNMPLNTGISINGSLSRVGFLGSAMRYFDTGITVHDGATLRVSSVDFESCKHGFICQQGSSGYLIGVNNLYNFDDSINVEAKDAGTRIYIDGSMFNCKNAISNLATGTGIKATRGAVIDINSTTIQNAKLGFECGDTGDDASTQIISNGVNLINCPYDLRQRGTATLSFVGGTIETPHLDFEDATNISFAAFKSGGKTTLSFGNSQDDPSLIYQIQNGQDILPYLEYKPNYYGTKGTIYTNSNTGTAGNAMNGVQSDFDNASYYAITKDFTKEAKIALISDSPAGSYNNIRGWEINKTGTNADLKFTFTNNNETGKSIAGPNTLMQLNGFDSKIEFPTSNNPTGYTAKLVWAPETDTNTNLYRDVADTLKTDANFIVGGSSTLTVPSSTPGTPKINFAGSTGTGFSAQSNSLSVNTSGQQRININSSGLISINSLGASGAGVVHNDASGNLLTSLIINNDITDNTIENVKLKTITASGKVANSATTATNVNATGTIVSRDSSGSFSAGTITANLVGNVSGNATSANTATSAVSATNFTGTLSGDISGTQSSTVVGTVGGKTAAEISSGTTLANSANSANNIGQSQIVRRDAFGNFAATTITANLTGNASGNVLKSGDIMTGALNLNPSSSTATNPSICFGSTGAGIYSDVTDTLSLETAGVQRLNINNTGTVKIPYLTTANGVIKNDGSGNLSSSLVTNANISNTAAISDTKLATIATAGKVANSATTATGANTPNTIVLRDSSGNFSANTITANLTGNVTGNLTGTVTGAATSNVLKAGDTMTGTLTISSPGVLSLSSGTETNPTILFPGTTGAGIFSGANDNLSFSTAGTKRLNINNTGDITISQFGLTPGLVHNDSNGKLTNSLLANTDIPLNTISDNKLQTITTAGKISNTATTANSATGINTIVARDDSGNFAANTITATTFVGNLSGNATSSDFATTTGSTTNFSGSLAGDITGTQSSTKVSYVGGSATGVSAANIISGVNTANSATDASTNGTVVKRSSTGNFSTSGTITASIFSGSLSGNATSATTAISAVSATNFTGTLSGEVSGTQGSTVVNTVGGQSASNIAAGAVLANAANSANNIGQSQIVRRDASGNFAATTITANLIGNASGNLLKSGDIMTGALNLNPSSSTATNPSISFGSTGAGIYSDVANTLSIETAGVQRLNINNTGTVKIPYLTTANGVIKNDGSGNLSSSLVTNSNISTSAAIDDTKLATISTAGKVSNSATTATGASTANTIVLRDSSGNFSANTITATTFSGALNGIANGNLPLTGGIISGALTIPSSNPGSPQLNFSSSNTTTGLSATGSTLSLNAAGAQQMSLYSTGAAFHNPVNMNSFGITGASSIGATTINAGTINVAGTADFATGVTFTQGTATNPSIKFTGSTNTGLSAATANTLSFAANGIEQMSISDTKIIKTEPICDQAILISPIFSANGTVTALERTSILMIRTNSTITRTITVYFPPNPVHGQKFTIMCLNSSTTTVNLIYRAGTGGASFVNLPSNLVSNIGGNTYIYLETGGPVANAWYIVNRSY